MPDNTVLPCSFFEHLQLICRAIDAVYFRTEIAPLTTEEENDPDIRNALATVRMFERTFSDGFGTVAVPVPGHINTFATTSRGHKGEPVIIRDVDFKEGIVYASGKATLNAPTLAGALAQTSVDTILVHRHDDDPLFDRSTADFAMTEYLFPGTLEEAHAVTKAFAQGNRRVKLLRHGDISIRPIRWVDWERYYKDFPERYFGIPEAMQEIIDKYAGWEALEVGCNEFACTKYAYDPYVEAKNAINLSWDEVTKMWFALVVAKNCVNYLTAEKLRTLVERTDRFVANTFLKAPVEKVTDEEAAVLVPGATEREILHTLRLKDDSIARHKFWARSKEDYEAVGLTVTPYGKNSALLTKGV